MKLMQFVMPVALAMGTAVIAKHGFPPNQMGLMMFMGAVQKHAGDAEVAEQINAMKAKVMPSM